MTRIEQMMKRGKIIDKPMFSNKPLPHTKFKLQVGSQATDTRRKDSTHIYQIFAVDEYQAKMSLGFQLGDVVEVKGSFNLDETLKGEGGRIKAFEIKFIEPAPQALDAIN